MNIKLTGALPERLRKYGIKPGNVYQDVPFAPGHIKGTVLISFEYDDTMISEIVYPENYVIVRNWKSIHKFFLCLVY
jgi:hypothetical protein